LIHYLNKLLSGLGKKTYSNKKTQQNRCLEVAWNEIKDRTGELKDGIFVKDEENSYIYESPDKGKTIYRREFGKTTREQIK